MEKRGAPPGWQRDSLTLAREIRGAPEEIFRALTDPEEILKWWGPPGPLTRAHVNLRPGGEYRFDFRGDAGGAGWVKGQYQIVEPERRIVKTWFSSRHPELRSSVELRLDPAADGTRVSVVHSGLAGRPDALQDYEKDWLDALDRLAARAQR
jgi:uncharacterized protein YndB with AHSA1/START domain